MRSSCVARRAWACALLLSACTPVTLRPSFAPLPEAVHVVINAPPQRVTQFTDSLLRADTVGVRRASLRDAFLETRDFAGTHRLRLWADPDVPELGLTVTVMMKCDPGASSLSSMYV